MDTSRHQNTRHFSQNTQQAVTSHPMPGNLGPSSKGPSQSWQVNERPAKQPRMDSYTPSLQHNMSFHLSRHSDSDLQHHWSPLHRTYSPLSYPSPSCSSLPLPFQESPHLVSDASIPSVNRKQVRRSTVSGNYIPMNISPVSGLPSPSTPLCEQGMFLVQEQPDAAMNVSTQPPSAFGYHAPRENSSNQFTDPAMLWDSVMIPPRLPDFIDQSYLSSDNLLLALDSDAIIAEFPTPTFSDLSLSDADSHAINTHSGNEASMQNACHRGQEEMVECLLNSGADTSTRDAEGQTILHLAAEQGHQSVVKLLLERGNGSLYGQDSNGQTALHVAAQNGHRAVVRLLLRSPGMQRCTNMTDIHGRTALHLASRGGYVAIIRLLIGRGADVNVRSAAGLTALHHAAENGQDGAVWLLLESGADVNAKVSED